MRLVPAGIALAVGAAALTACADRGETGPATATAALRIDTLASGAVRVVNDPTDPDRTPAGWHPRQLFRLGSDGSGDALFFSGVRDVELDSAGNVYVLDWDQSVRVFGPDGEHLRDLGREGDGPGEFRDARSLLLVDGSLWVGDNRARRTSVFAPDGSLVETYRGGSGYAVMTEDGVVYVSRSRVLDVRTPRRERYYLGMVPRDRVLEPVDTMWRPPEPEVPTWEAVPATREAGGVVYQIVGSMPVPFAPVPRSHVDPRGGFWTGTTDLLRFVRISPEGDTVRVVERVAEGRPVTDEERDRALGGDALGFGFVDPDPADIPDRMPVWSALFVDPDSRLWVERYLPPHEITPGVLRTWEVYDPDGVYLGAVELPILGDPTPAVRNGRLAGVTTDSLDVPYVVVYELWSAPAPSTLSP